LIDAVDELLALIPKSRKMEGLGVANDLFLHLEQLKRDAWGRTGFGPLPASIKSLPNGKA